MTEQVFYEDIETGSEIKPLVKHPTTMQLVKFAGASGDFYQIHYDKDFAQANGLQGVVLHGWLTLSFLGQLVTDWIGERGTLVKLGCSYRGVLFPGEDAVCKGKVTKKYDEDGKHYAEARIWVENSKGEKTTSGSAVVVLPSRN